jgi:hypothetical protein
MEPLPQTLPSILTLYGGSVNTALALPQAGTDIPRS